MKKWTAFLSLYFCLCLALGGCAGEGTDKPTTAPEQPGLVLQNPDPDASVMWCGPEVTGGSSAQVVDEGPWLVTCRVIDLKEGEVVLAEAGEEAVSVYTVTPAAGTEGLRPGQLVNVEYWAMTEGWPMAFDRETKLEVLDYGFDDRCALYLRVLEDLWNEDTALNSGVEEIGVDLSNTSLTPAERSAVGWAFASAHGAGLVEGTLQQLMEDGHISAEPLMISGSGLDLGEPKHYFYDWTDGCHYSITEREMEGTYSLTPVSFDAQKWRTSLGAYFYCGCTAVQSALGEWGGYTVEAHAIS